MGAGARATPRAGDRARLAARRTSAAPGTAAELVRTGERLARGILSVVVAGGPVARDSPDRGTRRRRQAGRPRRVLPPRTLGGHETSAQGVVVSPDQDPADARRSGGDRARARSGQVSALGAAGSEGAPPSTGVARPRPVPNSGSGQQLAPVLCDRPDRAKGARRRRRPACARPAPRSRRVVLHRRWLVFGRRLATAGAGLLQRHRLPPLPAVVGDPRRR